jgi:hypothetical protein
VWAETIIAPDRSLQKEPSMMLRRHFLPDVADGFEFCDHERASFLQGTEDIGCFLKIRSDYVLARSRARRAKLQRASAITPLFLVDNRV